MTDQTAAQTTAQTPVPGPEGHAGGLSTPPEGGHTGEPENGSQPREMRYRLERNSAVAERDALQTRLDTVNRREVERLASDGLSHPADLFTLSGNGVADYLTEDGDVDAEKVAADVAAVLAERPGLSRLPFPAGYDPTQGHGGPPNAKPEPSWGAVFATK